METRTEQVPPADAPLRLWTDGNETYIAKTAEEARGFQVELLGEADAHPLEGWKERTGPDPLTIEIEGEGKETKRIADWIRESGPGFLCSMEW